MKMLDYRHANLSKAIVNLYRTHWRLFWCILLPGAVVAISLDITQFFYLVKLSENGMRNTVMTPSRRALTVTSSHINTTSGIEPKIANTTNASPLVEWGLMPTPHFRATDGEGAGWEWKIKFKSLEYGALSLLLLTLCPISLAVARILRRAEVSETAEGLPPPTAREMWWQTGRKALTVFVATLLLLLIVDVGDYLYVLMKWLIPSDSWRFQFELGYILSVVPYTYFIGTLSLYNPCLILENNSLIGIFRRSHALVSGARLRVFGIYFLTGWIAAVITSVLIGVALLVFSMFISELAPIRATLASLKFLTLFIGADVDVVLPQVLSTPATVAILVVRGIAATFLVPIWAILTTRLYLERVEAIEGVTPFH